MSRTISAVEQFSVLIVRVLTAISLLVMTAPAWAWPPTAGAEFELSDEAMQNAPNFDPLKAAVSVERQGQQRFVQHVTARCASLGCRVTPVQGKWGANNDYRVEFADGWWFKVSFDPGCVEITFKPSTLQTLQDKAALINDSIFKTGAEIGLHVDADNTTHFNMGIRSAFDDSAENFLRFFVDYANHPDLALGSLGEDNKNAPPLSILGPEQRQALQTIIQDFYAGKLKTIGQVAQAIQSRVYTRSFDPSWGGIAHYQAFGLKYVNRTDLTKSDAPFELRAVWAQDSAERFNKVTELIQGRIRYLNTARDPIVYTALDRTEFNGSELRTRFAIYVEEAGMKASDFESLLPDWIRQNPYDDFVRRDANVWERLANAESYWDLLTVSPWVRQKMVTLLSDPRIQADKTTKRLLRRLQGETAVLAEADPRKKLMQDVLRNVQERMMQAPTKSAPLWRPLAPMCEKVFQ